jgi:CheY-like chemotaxis protein
MRANEGKLMQQHVLLVEDHEDCARSLRVLLELLGYQVEIARSGTEGLRLALALQPDVVISDIGLPGLDGWSLAAELRRHPATASAGLIAISAYGTQNDRRRSYQAGFDHHLTKPVDLALLLKVLRRPCTGPAPARQEYGAGSRARGPLPPAARPSSPDRSGSFQEALHSRA